MEGGRVADDRSLLEGPGSGAAARRAATPPSAPFRKLKPGPGLTAGAVAADQRRRIYEALVTLVLDRGYDRVSVRRLAEVAGVSTHTFYGHFANFEECFISLYDAMMLGALSRAAALSTAGQTWEEGLRAGVRSLLRDVASQPAAARVALVDAFVSGPRVKARVNAVVRTFEQLLGELLLAFPPRPVVPRHLLMGMVAGAMRVARATTIAGRADELPQLADELSRWLLSLPHTEAIRMLGTPPPGSTGPRREVQPFPDLRPQNEGAAIGDERERILSAVMKLAARDGFGRLTIPRIRTAAGVSRRAFDNYFDGAVDAFLESIEWMVANSAAQAGDWAAGVGGGRRTRRMMLALCALAARNHSFATVALVGILDAGRDGVLRRERLITIGAGHLRAGTPLAERPGTLAAEASLAAAWEIVAGEISAGRIKQLPSVAPLLSYVILAPASGPTSAAEASAS